MFERSVQGEWVVPGVPRDVPAAAAPAGPLAVPLSAEVRAYGEAVAALAAVDPASVDPAQALAEMAFLLEQERVLQGLRPARLADVQARRLHELDDAPTTAAWLRRSGAEVDGDELALAGRLPGLPAVQAALRGRRLTARAAGLVARAVGELRRHVDRPDGLVDGQDGEQVVRAVVVDGVLSLVALGRGGTADDDPALQAVLADLREIADRPDGQLARLEQALVVLAEQVPAVLLPGMLEQVVCAVLPVQLQERADRAHAGRGLRLVRKPDGGWLVRRGELDEETGELLVTVLQAARATDPDAPTDTAAWAAERAEGAVPSGEQPAAPRSRAQQDHDALRLALRRLLDSGALGTRGKQVPHLGVVVALGALHRAPGALPARSTATGAPLSLATVRRWLPDSRLTRYVLGLGHRVLETSHTERTLKGWERRVLELQWGGTCATAGCGSPPGTPLVPHHLRRWCATGTTSLADSVPLCECCHAALHRGARLRLRDGRTVAESDG